MDLTQCACSGKTLARLLRPVVLAMLSQKETHGYELIHRINEMKTFEDIPPDVSGVYKLLRSMEKEGLVSATWETGESGPAKRRYALTKDGKVCLKRWTETLEDYHSQIEELLAILRRGGAARKTRDRGGRCKCEEAGTAGSKTTQKQRTRKGEH